MRRVRRAGPSALVLVLLAALVSPASGPVLAGAVTWPTATLVLSELQTGGASASDEFVEIANQGAGPVDLLGLELVYATSSGSTVTRKASWSASLILASGRRTLIANGAGLLAGAADQIYSGGFAATGGALAAADHRRGGDRRGRVGRCDECVRRGPGRAGAGGRLEPRATARRPGWERRGHERQRVGLVPPGESRTAGARGAAGARTGRSDADAGADPADAEPDAERRRRPRRRARRPRRPRRADAITRRRRPPRARRRRRHRPRRRARRRARRRRRRARPRRRVRPRPRTRRRPSKPFARRPTAPSSRSSAP